MQQVRRAGAARLLGRSCRQAVGWAATLLLARETGAGQAGGSAGQQVRTQCHVLVGRGTAASSPWTHSHSLESPDRILG